ncbi:YeeE/YedE family protein [Paracoccus aestuarii]|uniref:YeeE/YedE family protein n=1 Tax=Paracoccus aestuarii TaxID=453842 RepID=A0A418ZQA1_9RHOB|nr:YeeE/YedE family protein [Paracoccus aestuarii]RJK97409.1 YeeE/YedE family protein [Paracoccus aestuarii]WCR00539.1 YeeE/YedE family protein [Paracoccus aestuarii]
MDDFSAGGLAALIGLAAGLVLGLAARLGDFCTLGALESALYGGEQRRARMWGVVLATAILGVQLGAMAGLIDLGGTIYHTVAWQPLASIAGGLVFGYGMALAGNCGFGALARMGGGDLRALVIVLVMGIAGFVALSGPLAALRIVIFPQRDATGPQGMLADLAALGLPPGVVVILLAGALLAWALASAELRASPRAIGWSVAVGLSVTGALIGTSWLAATAMEPVGVEGPSYTAPIGRTLIYLMTASGGGLSFAVGSVLGVVMGALAGSIRRGLFRWEACDDPRELGRQIGGAALMGVGGVVAMGCSVGQGVTGFATLAWSGPVTLIAICIGGWLGLRQLIGGRDIA